MKYTKIAHFWEWFERHHQTLLDLDSLTRTERKYWLAELVGHLKAYCRFLIPLLQRSGSGASKKCQLVISAAGRSSSFLMVDKLLKQAPRLREWEMIALEPPAGFDETAAGMLQQLQDSMGKLWFDIRDTEIAINEALFVFVEGDGSMNLDRHYQLCDLVYHMIGEKLYGERFGGVVVESYKWLTKKQRSHLAPLEKLPEYIKKIKQANRVAGVDGKIERVRLAAPCI